MATLTRRVIVIAPPDPIVSGDDVRLRLGTTDGDDVLDPLIQATCAQIEPPLGWTGRSFGEQTLELRTGWFADCWGGTELRLPYPPIQSIESVTYIDVDGDEQTVDEADYELIAGDGIPRLILSYGSSWPSARAASEAIRIQYIAGYDAADPQLEPAKNAVVLAVKQLRTLTTRDLYVSSVNIPGVGSRNYIVSENAGKVIQGAADALLSSYRVWL